MKIEIDGMRTEIIGNAHEAITELSDGPTHIVRRGPSQIKQRQTENLILLYKWEWICKVLIQNGKLSLLDPYDRLWIEFEAGEWIKTTVTIGKNDRKRLYSFNSAWKDKTA